MIQPVLAIETSCDDTSVAVVGEDGWVYSCVSVGQDQWHREFGGVVPEIAARNHLEKVLPLVESCLVQSGFSSQELAGVAVTARPGLLGSLMVGVVTAKALALAWGKPVTDVNHLVGHLYAPFLHDDEYCPEFESDDFLALTVSGGHTAIYQVESFEKRVLLGQTRDDAAGEAFDKFAKMVGLGYPGGPALDREARTGNPSAFVFPRPLLDQDDLEFSFSGLKSSAHRLLEVRSPESVQAERADLCASYQEAIVDCLVGKLQRAQKMTGCPRVVVTGGVSANSGLRARVLDWAQRDSIQVAIPPLRYCTDNAAMIGLVGARQITRGRIADQDLAPSPRSAPGDFVVRGVSA